MPLLGRESFIRQQLPPNVRPEDEIFYCKTTNEAFITYDEFFERQILCSSMVWTCTITGRTGLTYDEALQSERTATDLLNDFPNGLKIPVLYLANSMNESKIGSMVDRIYALVSNRYFIAEDIEVIVNTKRKSKGNVFKVIPPTNEEIIADTKDNKSFEINANLFKYEIIDCEKNRNIFGAEKITRSKGLLTKDKIRLFLRQHLMLPKRFQPLAVKDSSQKMFKLNTILWSHMFAGPEPDFDDQSSSDDNIDEQFNAKSSSSNTKNNHKKNPYEDKQMVREREKQLKIEQKNKEKEQKKQFEECMKEWSAKRDDLACDDLRPLPKPIPLKSKISVDLFADSVLVMEFFSCFSELFDMRSIFPFGITFELMEQILFDVDIDGPMPDILKVLLTSNLTLQQEDDESIGSGEKDDSDDEVDRHVVDIEDKIDSFSEKSEKVAKYYHNWIQSHLGVHLSAISLDPFNITEVLRLYLLSSGGGPQPRNKYRGLYHCREDPAIEFVAENKIILEKLDSNSIFDLKPNERLKIFHVLIHQLLSFFEYRDQIDDSFDEMSKLRKNIRDIQTEFNKWTKDNSLKRLHNKKDLQNDKQKCESMDSSPVPTAEQLDEYRKERTHKEQEMSRNCAELRTQIRRLQACYGLRSIGTDRAFRKYWIFKSLPGLFVEHMKPNTCYADMPFGPCLDSPTPNKSSKPNSVEGIDSSQRSLRDDSSISSDKENDFNTTTLKGAGDDKGVGSARRGSYVKCLSALDRCTANITTCAVHGSAAIDECHEWTFYYTSEHLNDLISSLNCRGVRESELKTVLIGDRDAIEDYMNKCVPNKLNHDIPALESGRRSQRRQEVLHSRKGKKLISRSTLEDSIVSALREYLISLEEKIFTGSLAVVSEMSREDWRLIVDRVCDDRRELVKNLSKAILVLTQSIRSMCLADPFNEENSVLQNWRQCLCEATSLSQLFVHLSILEQSIKWDKSALKAYCKICRRKCDAENMLLCDQCNRGHHTYCLQPPLNAIPHGEWLCSECVPKFKPQSPKKERNYTKTSEYETSDSEDTDDSEETEEDTESESSQQPSTSRSSTPSEDLGMCALCHRNDTDLKLFCAKCHQFYHLSCADVKRITRSVWFCANCSPINSFPRKRKPFINDIISDSSDSDQQECKPPKRVRRLRRFSAVNEELTEEEEESTTGARRRLQKISTEIRRTFRSQPLNKNLCEEILKQLRDHSDGWLFRSPPNHAPKYRKIIKSYVDFGQLVSRLNQGKYRSNSDFFRDILLMLNNASFYNQIQSSEYKSTQSLGQHFEQLLKQYNVDLKRTPK